MPQLLVQREAKETWKVLFAVPAPQGRDELVRASLPGVALMDRFEVRGSVVLAHDYTGCPFCGDDTIFSCGCGALNCAGGKRIHGDHKDYLCGGCARWQCMGKAGKMDSLSGFAQVGQRSQVEASHPRTVGGVERPTLPSGGALVRRG